MKSILILFSLCTLLASCDKIKNPYPKGQVIITELDTTLYPGNFANYAAPVFTVNANVNRNVLIEDYTGHKCVFCPLAADIAKQIEEDPASGNRVFVASIHSSPEPGGAGAFQALSGVFTQDFTCSEGKQYAIDFGTGYGFSGNPRGTINRINPANDMFTNTSSWQSRTTSQLTNNNLTCNIQAKADYFASTKGIYLHVEVDPIIALPASAKLVVYCVEDSLIAPQAKPGGITDPVYVHREIMRGTIDGLAFGRIISNATPSTEGNYVLKYSYILPTNIDKSNFHFLIYVMNGDTFEIMQVIKTKLTE